MKLNLKLFMSVVICFFGISSVYAKLFDGLVVSHQGDTLVCQLNVQVNMFNNRLVNSLSCKKKLKVIHEDGQKKTYFPRDIRLFVIFNTSEGAMTYESHIVEGEACFIQVINKGVFEVYKYYYPHGYDGSCQSYYTIRKVESNFIKLAPLRWRTQLQTAFPEDEYFVIEKMEKNYKYEQIPEFLLSYEN